MSTRTAPGHDPKATSSRYSSRERDASLAKAEGSSEYDVRRPLTRTGTNVSGSVKHVGSVQLGYSHEAFGGTHDLDSPWFADGAEVNADMWATADESREEISRLFRRSSESCDATVASLDLDAPGHVPWWRPENRDVTLHQVLVHVLAEVAHHAGHADIVRELVDGAAGDGRGNSPASDDDEWVAYRARVESAAVEASRRAGERP
ncbi:hypothetical protein OY671_005159 [Metschnikowia pulcherrima]|nr:hypothetical protein OY671_005159 [Metschnikowia pulcherrima]